MKNKKIKTARNAPKNEESIKINMKKRKVWKIASGNEYIARREWENFKEGGYVAIGFNGSFDCDDFSVFENKDELKNAYTGGKENPHDVDQVWKFVNGIETGDVVIVNHGLSDVYGIGIVESDYIAPTGHGIGSADLNHARKVNWVCTQPFKVIDLMFARHTLYELSDDKYFKIMSCYYNQFPELRNKLFSSYVSEFIGYLNTDDGKHHMKRYESESEAFKGSFLKIKKNVEGGMDQTDEILNQLIPQEGTLFVHENIPGNKKYFKAGYGYSNEQLKEFANLIYGTLDSFYQSKGDLSAMLNNFINNPCSKNIELGTLSASFYYLNNNYYVINSKTIGTVNDLNILDKGFVGLSPEIEDYMESNEKYNKYIENISTMNPELSSFECFDAFCQWYMKNYGRISICCYKEGGNPIPQQPKQMDMPKLSLNPNGFNASLKINEDTVYDLTSLLNSGKHIILKGVPGTGKTQLARKICEYAKDNKFIGGFIAATATSSWTTFDLIGGLMPNDNGGLVFEEGLFLKSIRNNYFLIIDELNRADIDKAFGQLFSVLSGMDVELNFKKNNGNIKIKATDENKSYFDEGSNTYFIGRNFRIIATMNTYDKDSLYELSYAFMRRFAFVEVDIPNKDMFDELIEHYLKDTMYIEQIKQLYELNNYRKLGMSIFKDMSDYIKEITKYTNENIIEKAIISFIMPQYEGLSPNKLDKIRDYLIGTMDLNRELIESGIEELKGLAF